MLTRLGMNYVDINILFECSKKGKNLKFLRIYSKEI